MNNCKNCGAPIKNHVCNYCGSQHSYGIDVEDEIYHTQDKVAYVDPNTFELVYKDVRRKVYAGPMNKN